MADVYINIPDSGSPQWKSPVATAADLPLLGNSVGDVRVALDSDTVYVWNGSAWIPVASPGAVTAITALLGDVTANGPGAVAATVNFVGGVSAANVASGANLANAGTSANTPNTLVKRGPAGEFSAGVITASFVGNVTGNVSGTSANVTGIVLPSHGGTGIANNDLSTISISGAFPLSLTLSGSSSLTLPTAGTLATLAGIEILTNKTIDASLNTLTNITNTSISATAAIAYSKLNLTNSIVNADINAAAAIAYSKLNLTNSIVNADIAAAAAIARSKIAAGSANQVVVNDGAGNLSSVAVLPVANGGTGISTSFTSGSVIFSNGTTLAQDNAKFFWDDTNFRLGIGLNTPTESLHISNNATNRIFNDAYGTGSVPVIAGRMARGTFAAPTATQLDDLLLDLSGRGYNGTAFSTGKGTFFVRAAEAWSGTANGSYITISTTPVTTTTLTERLRINNTGNVLIATTTDNNVDKLQVNGSATVVKAFKLTPFALTDAANIATDASLSNNFTVTLAGNRNLSAPTNPTDKQKVVWEFKQDATGNRTLTFDAIFNFGVFPTLVLSGGANKKDYMGAIYDSVTSTWDVVAYSVAF